MCESNKSHLLIGKPLMALSDPPEKNQSTHCFEDGTLAILVSMVAQISDDIELPIKIAKSCSSSRQYCVNTRRTYISNQTAYCSRNSYIHPAKTECTLRAYPKVFTKDQLLKQSNSSVTKMEVESCVALAGSILTPENGSTS